jgi:hypothetical protein
MCLLMSAAVGCCLLLSRQVVFMRNPSGKVVIMLGRYQCKRARLVTHACCCLLLLLRWLWVLLLSLLLLLCCIHPVSAV